MCRSIQTLRPPYVEDVTEEQVRAAALQYVRKVAGMRAPSVANGPAFTAAVEEVTAATARLLAELVVRPGARRPEAVEREAARRAARAAARRDQAHRDQAQSDQAQRGAAQREA